MFHLHTVFRVKFKQIVHVMQSLDHLIFVKFVLWRKVGCQQMSANGKNHLLNKCSTFQFYEIDPLNAGALNNLFIMS